MSKLIQAVKFKKRETSLLDKSKTIKTEIENIEKAFSLAMKHIYPQSTGGKFEDDVNKLLLFKSNELRYEYWKDKFRLPKGFEKIHLAKGLSSDALTVLNDFPKANIKQYRELAEKLNMVIVPIEYVELDKLFKVQPNYSELRLDYNFFDKVLNSDPLKKYQNYIICPLEYYSVWKHITSDVEKEIFYASSLENIFMTIELMIPTQKNLYLNIKNNTDSISTIQDSFNSNIETLNSKIAKISSRVKEAEDRILKVEIEQKLQEKLRIAQEEQHEKEIKALELKLEQQQTRSLYFDYDPIIFAVEDNVNVLEGDDLSIIGLAWGADIDDEILQIKNIDIQTKTLKTVQNKLNLRSKYSKLNFEILDSFLLEINTDTFTRLLRDYDRISLNFNNDEQSDFITFRNGLHLEIEKMDYNRWSDVYKYSFKLFKTNKKRKIIHEDVIRIDKNNNTNEGLLKSIDNSYRVRKEKIYTLNN